MAQHFPISLEKDLFSVWVSSCFTNLLIENYLQKYLHRIDVFKSLPSEKQMQKRLIVNTSYLSFKSTSSCCLTVFTISLILERQWQIIYLRNGCFLSFKNWKNRNNTLSYSYLLQFSWRIFLENFHFESSLPFLVHLDSSKNFCLSYFNSLVWLHDEVDPATELIHF